MRVAAAAFLRALLLSAPILTVVLARNIPLSSPPVVGVLVLKPWAKRNADFSPRVFRTEQVNDADAEGAAGTEALRGAVRTASTQLQPGEAVAAWATFSDTIGKNGWSRLDLHSNASLPNAAQAYAAGWLEANLTQARIWQHATNTGARGAALPPQVAEYVKESNSWLAQQIDDDSNAHSDYWEQVSLALRQFDGLVEGYSHTAPASEGLSRTALQEMSFGGDFGTLAGALTGEFNGTPGPNEAGMGEPSHCSALVKLTEGNGELFVAQDTWTSFNTMLRIFKSYDLPYTSVAEGAPAGTRIPGERVVMSSYPGSLFSGDDWYQMAPSQLVVQETTIGNNNAELWKKGISPKSVWEWVRNMVANRLARNGEEWTATFGRYNNGCYNNQFMVVDMKRFTPGEVPKAGTLWVLEQLPTFVKSEDMTDRLVSDGYWGSYNLPEFDETYLLGDWPNLVAKYGDWFNPNKTARAVIFRERHSTVHDLASMQALMRQNDFEHDPLSRCDCTPPYTSENAVATRGDLNPADGKYPISAFAQRNHAATDTKISSHAMITAEGFASSAISSPTYESLPAFVWSKSPYANTSHVGQPDRWEFPFVEFSWTSSARLEGWQP